MLTRRCRRLGSKALLWVLACLVALACRSRAAPPVAAGSFSLAGAGSTSVAPFLRQALAAYTRGKPIRITYQPAGSGAGIEQFSANQVDFVVADAPLDGMDLALVGHTGGPVAQFPILLQAVAVVYNEPKIAAPIRLDGAVLAAIFMGAVTTWNNPAIARLNPRLRLPYDRIAPVHRWDSSGTTAAFTAYLSQASRAWAHQIGTGNAVAWRGGFHGIDSSGVARWVRLHEGAIGYVEMQDALAQHLPFALLKNRAGVFVPPTSRSIAAAAMGVPGVSAARPSIVNAPGRASYPLACYAWVALRQTPHPPEMAVALSRLFQWLIIGGRAYAHPPRYLPLPAGVQRRAAYILASIHAP